ncbi:MAG TPA: hypothetical protein VFL84_10510 [Gammaproteobacteria bacterium]|nr:hypothetical protein [Gammaproteobacteria bacterium]
MRRAFKLSLGLVVLFAALSIVLLAATIYTYDRLSGETLIAELRFDATGDRQYLAHLRTGDRCEDRTFPLYGDQWRIDAEFLKWKYWALLLGLDSQYRLDRLEGRYRSVAEQNSQRNVAHALGERTAVDVVALAESLGSWNFLLDATYGSSTYQDIDVGDVYYVYRTTTGIITRHEPRPVQTGGGAAFDVTIDGACNDPSMWQRFTEWTDDGVVAALELVER